MKSQQGYTLIEVLIALAIVSIALAACMRALALSTGGVRAMQERSLALQAAENVMAEIHLRKVFPQPGKRTSRCPQGPLAFNCESSVQSTANRRFRQITISVRQGDEGPALAVLHGTLSALP